MPVKEKSIEEQFKRKELHNHVLDAPDTYIGSIDEDQLDIYYYDDKTDSILKGKKNIVLGLYKIFDEIVVNAADNTVRNSKKCNVIKTNIDRESGYIEVYNNGSEIPIEWHKDEKMYVPELIFGTLLTSGNYDQKDKLVGGKNGLGSKLVNIYSSEFIIEVVDSKRKKKFVQTFTNNMFTRQEPIITDLEEKEDSYIKIKFLPDYKRLNQKKGLSKDMYQVMKRRIYDMAGVTNKKVKVYFNDEEISSVHNFESYIKLYYKNSDKKIIYKEVNERWSVGIIYDPDSQFDHMTFVNKINTFKGGTHLDHVVNQIVNKVTQKIIAKDKKNNIKVKPSQIKDNISVFINSSIEDPDFSSQSKETLTTKSSKFKIKCELDTKFIDEICKTGIVEDVFEISKVRHENELSKTDGNKRAPIKGLPKLKNANYAGTDKSSKCMLIVTEGDSAFSFADAGREVIGTDYYGAVPLKGKLLNPKKSATQKALDNDEFNMLKKALGLKHGMIYENTKSLRYGSVLLLTDQDDDGYHIKGLFINFIHTYWPSLLKIDGFIKSIATPIIKVYKSTSIKNTKPLKIFFTQTEYKNWSANISKSQLASYYIKYFKGLGTSTTEEARESFEDFESKLIDYVWDPTFYGGGKKNNKDNDSIDDDDDIVSVSAPVANKGKKKKITDFSDVSKSEVSILTAFADSYEDDRKDLVRNYDPDVIIENNQKRVTFTEFVDKELVHFFHSDVMRSVPNICDGLKPSQRKILYGTFLRKLDKTETKVSQLSGYISDNAGYHHGEMSLQGAIIDMAQDFVGSNNINLLYPSGTFGSRRKGGKDHASPRYIFTKNGELLRCIFPVEDEPILELINDENEILEPHTYFPVIPLILVNGCSGIGTGFSSTIPSFNVKDLIGNIKIFLDKHNKYDNKRIIKEFNKMLPWYKGFTGKIEQVDECTYRTYGVYEIIDQNTIKITELPIGKWTEDYIAFLAKLIENNEMIVDYNPGATVYKVNITITLKNNMLQTLRKNETLMTEFKLVSTLKTSNMHLCKIVEDEDDSKKIKTFKYNGVNDILMDYIDMRFDAYVKRKKYYVRVLENDLSVLEYRKKFIEYIFKKKIILERRRKDDVIASLEEHKFPRLGVNVNSTKSYDYLTSLSLFSLTQDKIDELEASIVNKSKELDVYKNTTVEDLWINDLDKFEKNYDKYHEEYIIKINAACGNKNKNSKKISKSSSNSKSSKSKKTKSRSK
jgi:DNA topoisomerase II